jgi:hypothetical protein
MPDVQERLVIEDKLDELRDEVRRTHVDFTRIREALERVEWVSQRQLGAEPKPFCPWCGATKAAGRQVACVRQIALGYAEPVAAHA